MKERETWKRDLSRIVTRRADLERKDHPGYFILGSCAPFEPDSPFAGLVGAETAAQLQRRGVCGDFLYQFVGEDGGVIEAPWDGAHSVLDAGLLRTLSTRPDARVIVVAGGPEKLPVIRRVLTAGWCNTLISDERTVRELLNLPAPSTAP